MIDKIDRPEAPQPYQITRAKDAKESQHQQSHQREGEEKRRQKELTEKQWEKFDRRTTTIKPMRAARADIARCLFRAVSLHSGMGILQVDVIWKDGRATNGALVLLGTLEDFIALKKMNPGEPVPDKFWARGSTVEFGILQVLTAGTNLPAAAEEKKTPAPAPKKAASILSRLGILDQARQKISWGIVALYVFLLSIVVFAIIVELRLWERT